MTLTEQVAQLKAGDWVEAIWKYKDAEVTVKGKLRDSYDSSLEIGGYITLKRGNGYISAKLTSIRKIERPIPDEPERGSFALLNSGSISSKQIGDELNLTWRNNLVSGKIWHSWPEIYPHITKLYTPQGDLVEGFEYYKLEGKDYETSV